MLNAKQVDTITEIINIGVGKGSASLSQMIDGEILLNVPYVNVITFSDVLSEIMKLGGGENVHSVEMKFSGEYEGSANVILPGDSAAQLASLLIHEDPDSATIKEMKDGLMIEVGNIILNAIMGSFGNILDAPLDYHMPKSYQGDVEGIYGQLDKDRYNQVLVCHTNFSIRGKNISGDILIMYEMGSFDKLSDVLNKMIES
jgi:chemotaxis protein CheC